MVNVIAAERMPNLRRIGDGTGNQKAEGE